MIVQRSKHYSRTYSCLNCKSNDIINDLKQNVCVCRDCGTVLGNCDQIIQGQTFDQSCQMSVTEHYQQLGSFVDKKHRISQMRINQKSNSKAQNRMRNLSKKLEDIQHKMSLCKRITDRASVLMYTSLQNKNLKRIKKDELLAAVCIILASREARIQFTFREISSACANVTKKEICRVYKMHERVLNKQITRNTKLDVDRIRFSGMINRFTSLLGIEWLQQKRMRKLYNNINRKPGLSTLNPLTRLTCAIYLIMGETKENCANVSLTCSVSEHTILRSSELILQHISL